MSFENFKRIVIKVGSSSLTYDNGRPNLRRMEKLAQVICDMKNSGKEVVLVSSGAIAVGMGRLGLKTRPTETKVKQAMAAVGQCDLMSYYDRFFSEFGYVTAQILINRDIVEHENRRMNVVNTIQTLLSMDVVPIINENDSVSVEELVFGDNDTLSAIVAQLAAADGLVILTDIDGLYDSDPRENENARLIAKVEKITDEMMQNATANGSNRGTGGMRSKLEAAKYACENGIDVVIMSGQRPQKIYDLLEGRSVGTYFMSGGKNNA
ncbi:MAG: glutamate 5-kinase [bacterium]|nr:glutamate 5-kinase [bacterium]